MIKCYLGPGLRWVGKQKMGGWIQRRKQQDYIGLTEKGLVHKFILLFAVYQLCTRFPYISVYIP